MSQFYISNPTSFERKISKIKSDGINSLHIISDFDRTLTGQQPEGKITTTSWAIFQSILGNEYTRSRQELFNYYYPIEKDESLDIQYRCEQMIDWWQKHLRLLIKYGVSRKNIEEAVSHEGLHLRGGVDKLFKFCNNHNIPLLVFSAGVGDAIKLFLDKKGLVTENIHIVSNFFIFDTNNTATGFKGGIVHSLNKNESLIEGHPYYKEVLGRKNCILLGDTISDTSIADGISHETILKIGFMNGNESQKDDFIREYDLIIEHDTDVEAVNELLECICQK